MPRILHNLKIHEVSSVTRGAGEGVRIKLMKSDDVKALDLSAFLKTGDGGIFAAAVAHGASVQDVAKAEVTMEKSISSIEKADGKSDAELQSLIEKSVTQCVDHLAGLVSKEKIDDFRAAVAALTVNKESPMTDEEKKAAAAAVKKAETLRKSFIAALPADHQEFITTKKLEGDALDAWLEKSADDKAADVAASKKKPDPKADDEATEKALQAAIANSPIVKELQAKLQKSESANTLSTFQKSAEDLGLPAGVGEVFMKAFAGDADAQVRMLNIMKGLTNQAETAVLFKEFGSNLEKGADDPQAEVQKAAEDFMKSDAGKGKSIYQARAHILKTNTPLAQRVRALEKKSLARAS